MQKENRKRTKVMHIYLTEEEYEIVCRNSTFVSQTISTYGRNVCLGYKVESRVDALATRELLKVNADLGRLGGLLKLAITDENRREINSLLRKIDTSREELKEKIRKL